MAGTGTKELSPTARHRKAILIARVVYISVALCFLAICTIAVTIIMAQEKQNTGFQAITVK